MQFYFASKWENKALLLAHRRRVMELGHTVHARWLTFEGERPAMGSNEWMRFAEHWQAVDLEDIDACDVLICDVNSDNPSNTGGTFVEFGYALRAHKEIWVIGRRPNVFFCNPEVLLYPNWTKVFKALGGNDVETPTTNMQKVEYSLSTSLTAYQRCEAGTLVMVPNVAELSNSWTCLDADQQDAEPGMKVVRKIK